MKKNKMIMVTLTALVVLITVFEATAISHMDYWLEHMNCAHDYWACAD